MVADVREGLAWVHRNCGHYGGDVSKVSLWFGAAWALGNTCKCPLRSATRLICARVQVAVAHPTNVSFLGIGLVSYLGLVVGLGSYGEKWRRPYDAAVHWAQ